MFMKEAHEIDFWSAQRVALLFISISCESSLNGSSQGDAKLTGEGIAASDDRRVKERKNLLRMLEGSGLTLRVQCHLPGNHIAEAQILFPRWRMRAARFKEVPIDERVVGDSRGLAVLPIEPERPKRGTHEGRSGG